MQTQQADMTDFKLPPKPDPKEPVSVRMPASLKAKVLWIVEVWKEVARAKNEPAEVVDAIDFPYVLLTMLAGRADAELQEFKGFPESEAAKAEQLKAVRASVKKQQLLSK